MARGRAAQERLNATVQAVHIGGKRAVSSAVLLSLKLASSIRSVRR